MNYHEFHEDFGGISFLPKAIPVAVRSQSNKKLFSDFTHKSNEPFISHLEFTSLFFNVREKSLHLSLLHAIIVDSFYC